MNKISFIVPVYKVEKYIHQCVESILQQTYENIEVILIDDGSPDNCPQICDEYKEMDKRIKVIHKKNEGVSIARNCGIDASTGDWLYFVDSDDWIEKDAAENLISDAIKYDADCVMSDGVQIYDDGRKIRIKEFAKAFYTDDRETIQAVQKFVLCRKYSPYYIPHVTSGYAAPWGKFVKAEIIKKYNIRFDSRAKGVFDDGVYSLYLLEHVNKFYYNQKHTYNYRLLGNSLTHAFKTNAMEILKENYKLVDEFIKNTKKDDSYVQAERCRRLCCFTSHLSSYYFNPLRNSNEKEIKEELLSDIHEWPYNESFKMCLYKNLEAKHKFILFAGRHEIYGLLKLYPIVKRLLNRK